MSNRGKNPRDLPKNAAESHSNSDRPPHKNVKLKPEGTRVPTRQNEPSASVQELQTDIEQRAQAEANLQERLEFEELITQLSANLVKVGSDQLKAEIKRGLHQIMEFFQADRCNLVSVGEDGRTISIFGRSRSDDVKTLPDKLDAARFLPAWYDFVVRRGTSISVSRLADLPPEAGPEREFLSQLRIRSLLQIPVFVGGIVRYVVSVSSGEERSWSEEYVPRLRLLGEVFASALERKALEESQNDLIRLKGIIAEFSAAMLNASSGDVDSVIDGALRRLLEFFEADQCNLFHYIPQTGALFITHRQYNEGVAPSPIGVDLSKTVPWGLEKVMKQGEVLSINRTNDKPDIALEDKKADMKYGARSHLTVPIPVGGAICYAISLVTHKHERVWPEEYIPRLRLLGESIVGALERKRADEELRTSYDEIRRLKDLLQKEAEVLREEITVAYDRHNITGQSEGIKKVLRDVEKVAPTDSTVLILGETGTGKELVARAIHSLSPRSQRPMITVNCASLPPALIDNEFFGREKGAYTGALTNMVGRFEVANGSTIFLDEVGELPLDIQGKLLKVLEEGNFERLGSTKTIKVDVRVIAATNRDLARDVKDKRFREDLFYRLNVFSIRVPPLREQSGDIPSLVWKFVNEFGERMGKRIDSISAKSMENLQRYTYPGNVRELRNVIERAMIVSTGRTLTIEIPRPSEVDETMPFNLDEMERRHILRVLEKCGWRIDGRGGAAQALGLKRTTLLSRMKKLGIHRPAT